MMITQEDIAKRAREIWEKEGRPEGRNLEHWLQAESDLNEQSFRQTRSQQDHSEPAAVAEPVASKNGGEKRKRSGKRSRSSR
jgi:hypothetical protein